VRSVIDNSPQTSLTTEAQRHKTQRREFDSLLRFSLDTEHALA